MIESDVRAQRFVQSIREDGERRCKAIEAETERLLSEEMEQARSVEEKKAERMIRFEQERMEAEFNRTLSAQGAQARASLAQKRMELTDQVFSDVREALAAYTKTEAYAQWLIQSATRLCDRLGAGCVLYAREQDMKLLQGKLPAGVSVSADAAIVLGGLKAQNAQISADDTLDSRLAAQKDWFLENSGLSVAL